MSTDSSSSAVVASDIPALEAEGITPKQKKSGSKKARSTDAPVAAEATEATDTETPVKPKKPRTKRAALLDLPIHLYTLNKACRRRSVQAALGIVLRDNMVREDAVNKLHRQTDAEIDDLFNQAVEIALDDERNTVLPRDILRILVTRSAIKKDGVAKRVAELIEEDTAVARMVKKKAGDVFSVLAAQ